MNNKYLRLFALLLCPVILLSCMSSCGKDSDPETPDNSSGQNGNNVSSDEHDPSTFFEMDGVLVDFTDSTVTVQIPNGDKYTFSTEGVEVSKDRSGIKTGCPIIVGYYGALDDFAEVQNVDVSIIAIGKHPSLTYVEEKMANMSLEEKVGQMFFARCPGGNAAADVKSYHLGGYILFASNVKDKTKDQLKSEISACQKASDTGMFIGVDEEGGTVVRVSKYSAFRSKPFASPRDVFASGGWDLIKSDAKEKAKLLSSLGFNVNFAPVCDVPSSSDDFIYKRAFSTDPKECAKFAETVIPITNQNGVAGCLKHFPGYGNNVDTHTGIAYDERGFETFEKRDFIPFISGINAGAKFIMVSHNIVKCMDEKRPASLSPEVHNILRSDLGFEGIMITDDISMQGITDFTDNADAAVLAVLAGNDMLCCTDYKEQIPAVIKAVKDGTIDEELIDSAVKRILLIKYEMGIAK
ncbi:MAG: beta-hexosaminidase [Clostridia bacterium]|nr:beta-hexosaminidase [Clostridia bacterium]